MITAEERVRGVLEKSHIRLLLGEGTSIINLETDIADAIRAAEQAQREQDAKIADKEQSGMYPRVWNNACEKIAERIRAQKGI